LALRRFGAEIAMAWMSRAAYHAPTGPWTLVGRLGGYYDLKYFRRCSHLVGNTRDIAQWIAKQGWPRERVAYLPNFVADFSGDQPAVLDVPAGAKLVLGLGRLHEVKAFDVLIRAVARLADVYCVIAGEGPERAALARLIDELGVGERVRLLGWRTDTGPLLRRADVFVSSSRHEPLGNMVLEAFSAGTAVVAARAEGPGEVIRDGIDGVLVPVDDVAAMADAIRAVLADSVRAAALGAAGRARYEAEFSETGVLAIWHAYFNTLKAA
jgi:glycosyltransferase involved in cell wall biosynthesis